MKRFVLLLCALFLLFVSAVSSIAAPISPQQAENVVKNWLVRLDSTVALRFS